MNTYVSNRLQAHKPWFQYSEERIHSLRQELSRESKDYILNTNETDYQQFLFAKYKLVPLRLAEDTIIIHPPRQEKHRSKDQDQFERSPYYWVCSIACQVGGSSELWGILPSTFRLGGRPDFAVSNGTLTFVFNIQSQNADEFNRKKNEAFAYLKDHVNSINNECIAFNEVLPSLISTALSKLKNDYLKENSFFATINVTPNPDAPRTYSVPIIEKRPPIHKPNTQAKAFTVEPTVDQKTYKDIIDCLTRVGLSFERKPSLYIDKDEEALRDLFLLQLELAFEGGTATGETFNRSGKTDILLKNTDGTNLFVGECKVWRGPKQYLEAISQLLNYLTWDDSKTALLVFVKDVALSTVIQTVKKVTVDHRSAIRLVEVQRERFMHYTFSLPQDSQKLIAIQVMLFHFDKTAEGRD